MRSLLLHDTLPIRDGVYYVRFDGEQKVEMSSDTSRQMLLLVIEDAAIKAKLAEIYNIFMLRDAMEAEFTNTRKQLDVYWDPESGTVHVWKL